ncbi:MAG: serine/threonine-protein kinase [Thermodesulfobacteriota bacterium]|nr:serine/threonine-protein kinase [Thermodesulfobacteriota bacterium]
MEQIKGYHIGEQIGRGGMATVYKGVQLSLNRPVAIKVLLKKLTDRSSILERFNRESIIIARLNHPHIIHIIDRGITTEEMPYFVMEYVKGIDLQAAIQSRALDYNRSLDLVIQVCKALSYAHKNGVIHRDIKPSNILIDQEGHARVLDFGIAQFYEAGEKAMQYTGTDTIMGTLEYMSPEQRHSAGDVTALSDLYSLGVVMYELFTGVRPTGRFQLPSQIDPTIPEPLQEVIMTCLETDPVNRPVSAEDIKDQLLKLLSGAHLRTDQRNRANQGMTSMKEKFALLDVIREESYGSVYLYEDRVDQKLLVIKKQPSTSTGFMEAKLLTSLGHRNIANIMGTSKNEDFFIVVMEYLSGGSLKDRLVRPYPVDDFLTAARQICEGLSFAHRNRIVHGNLRPSNILFSASEEVKVSDFGLNEHYGEEESESNWYNPADEAKSVQGDILATGVIFYEMLTGALPTWNSDTPCLHDVFESHPKELGEMVTRMLSIDPATRYRSFEEVRTAMNVLCRATAEPAMPEPPTEILEGDVKPDVSGKSVPFLLLSLIVLILLFVPALFYLVCAEDVSPYVHSLTDFWDRLVK